MPGDVASDVAAVPGAPATAGRPDAIFRAYTEKQRRKWLHGHYRQVVNCRLKPSDFRPARKAHYIP
jgi:hypothetical protein